MKFSTIVFPTEKNSRKRALDNPASIRIDIYFNRFPKIQRWKAERNYEWPPDRSPDLHSSQETRTLGGSDSEKEADAVCHWPAQYRLNRDWLVTRREREVRA